MKISFVIPCYKSKNTIKNVVSEIEKAIDEKVKCDYEIILVNDASPDDTYNVLKEIAQKNSNVIAINLAKNSGQASATMCGFKYATGDYIVCGDDDCQTPFNEVYKLKDKLENEGYDAVCGKYINRDQKNFLRNFGSKVNIKMSELILDQPKNIYMSVFFIAKRFVIDEMLKYTNPYPYITGLLLRTTNNIGNVEVEQRKRESGNSGYNFKKLISLWLNGFTTFSIKPLRLSSFIGFFCSIIGFIFGIVTVARKLLNFNISIGWSSIISILLFIGGIIMIMLGMIGEYIGRIYISINNSPQYVIKEKYSIDILEGEKNGKNKIKN